MPSLFLRYLGKGQLQCWSSNRCQWISRAVPNTARPVLFLKTMLEFALQWEKDRHKSKAEPEHKYQSNKTTPALYSIVSTGKPTLPPNDANGSRHSSFGNHKPNTDLTVSNSPPISCTMMTNTTIKPAKVVIIACSSVPHVSIPNLRLQQ